MHPQTQFEYNKLRHLYKLRNLVKARKVKLEKRLETLRQYQSQEKKTNDNKL